MLADGLGERREELRRAWVDRFAEPAFRGHRGLLHEREFLLADRPAPLRRRTLGASAEAVQPYRRLAQDPPRGALGLCRRQRLGEHLGERVPPPARREEVELGG